MVTRLTMCPLTKDTGNFCAVYLKETEKLVKIVQAHNACTVYPLSREAILMWSCSSLFQIKFHAPLSEGYPSCPFPSPSSGDWTIFCYLSTGNISNGRKRITFRQTIYPIHQQDWISYNKWDNCHIPTLRAHNLTKPTKHCIMIKPVGRLGQGVSHNISPPPSSLSLPAQTTVSPNFGHCLVYKKLNKLQVTSDCPLLKLFVRLYCMYF